MTNENGRRRRWIRLTLIALGIGVLLAAVAMMIGGGAHGPARHLSFAEAW